MKKSVLTTLIAVVLMLASLLNVKYVSQISYEAVHYGFPFEWLVYYIQGIVPVNQWLPNPVGLVIDFLFWLATSFAIVSIIPMLKNRSSHRAEVSVSNS